MGRPPKDNLRLASDRELQEMQRVLRGWYRIAALREALLAADAPDGPALTDAECQVDGFFKGQLVDALAVAIARPDRPQDPEEVLARFADQVRLPEAEQHIQFLRDLQSLRSCGSGHRNGSSHEKALARLGDPAGRKADVVRNVLEKATRLLDALAGASSAH